MYIYINNANNLVEKLNQHVPNFESSCHIRMIFAKFGQIWQRYSWEESFKKKIYRWTTEG